MEDARLQHVNWLFDLMDRVRASLASMADDEPNRQAALDAEVAQLDQQLQGWTRTLSNPELSPDVRSVVEQSMENALARLREIEASSREQASRQQRADDVLDPMQVLDRLDSLADVLAANNPTKGNLELSMHIDRIVCHPDGKVEMRTCKLGGLTDVIDLLADPLGTPPDGGNDSPTPRPVDRRGVRRRNRLRVDEADGDLEHLRSLADFAADPGRFGGLADEWFQVDTFQMPLPQSWPEANAEKVWARVTEILRDTGKKPSLKSLGTEFGKSRPTIAAAIKIAQHGPPLKPSRRDHSRRRNHEAREMADEFVRLHRDERLLIRDISIKTGFHRNIVARVLDERLAELGIPRPDGRKSRWGREKK